MEAAGLVFKMMPGMNPKMMKQAMKRMGIKQEEIDANRVVIYCEGKEIHIDNPQVSKVNMMGTDTYQVVGEVSEHEADASPEINEEDVKTVMDVAGVSEDEARAAIEKAEGDLSKAIMELKDE